MTETPETVFSFWFEKLTPKDWFTKNEVLDREIATRFTSLHLDLSRGAKAAWRASPQARLALLIAYDQFPRNIYRGSALSFATDGLALREAKLALATGADRAVDPAWRLFFYLPFEHTEELAEQDRSVALHTELGDATYLDHAIKHRDVIVEFGRFPHRNAILGRPSSAAEEAYLAKPGAGF